jgi:hypothetical protein
VHRNGGYSELARQRWEPGQGGGAAGARPAVRGGGVQGSCACGDDLDETVGGVSFFHFPRSEFFGPFFTGSGLI